MIDNKTEVIVGRALHEHQDNVKVMVNKAFRKYRDNVIDECIATVELAMQLPVRTGCEGISATPAKKIVDALKKLKSKDLNQGGKEE